MSQVLLLRAALNPLSAQPVSVHGSALSRVQDLVLGLAKLHDVHPSLPLKVSLGGSPSLLHVDCTRELGAISTPATSISYQERC